jgi:hypothetical protein
MILFVGCSDLLNESFANQTETCGENDKIAKRADRKNYLYKTTVIKLCYNNE